jgi:hypothetical protein
MRTNNNLELYINAIMQFVESLNFAMLIRLSLYKFKLAIVYSSFTFLCYLYLLMIWGTPTLIQVLTLQECRALCVGTIHDRWALINFFRPGVLSASSSDKGYDSYMTIIKNEGTLEISVNSEKDGTSTLSLVIHRVRFKKTLQKSTLPFTQV